jgi:5-deoxy-D-glucuronate isomerase
MYICHYGFPRGYHLVVLIFKGFKNVIINLKLGPKRYYVTALYLSI